jgi:S1-C subfamily serine protease
MFLSVVSVGLALAAPNQVGRLSDKEQAVWKRMEPAIVMVLNNGKPTGPAALIDRKGLFIAHRQAVSSQRVQGRTNDGHSINLSVRSVDPITQMVLLEADQWNAERARPFSAPQTARPGGTLLAVLATGPIRAELISTQKFGVVKPNSRLVPLSEFRFEAPAEAVGTALVFTENGEFFGSLHATLGTDEAPGRLGGNSVAATTSLPRIPGLKIDMGPSALTVAYTAGPDLVRRVMEGFRSESQEVDYPTLGVFCRDNIGGGALVQKVTPGSAAAEVGIRVGDVIVDIGGNLIANQVDFARVMLNQRVGQKITIRIKRGSQTLLVDPVVQKSE